MEESVFTRCLEGIKNVKSEDGDMMTKPFLDVCKLILPILGSFIFFIKKMCMDYSSINFFFKIIRPNHFHATNLSIEFFFCEI